MAYVSTQRRPNTSAPSDGSRTITLTGAPPTERGNADSTPNTEPSGAVGSLRLRGSRTRSGPRVSWKDDVVDNEGCGRKSSKVCCIYHKPRPFDESSDEDSDSDSDSDSECTHRHNHPHTGPHREGTSSRRLSGGESMQSRPSGSSLTHQLDDSDSDKNAYEVMPSSRKGKGRC